MLTEPVRVELRQMWDETYWSKTKRSVHDCGGEGQCSAEMQCLGFQEREKASSGWRVLQERTSARILRDRLDGLSERGGPLLAQLLVIYLPLLERADWKAEPQNYWGL